MRIHSETVVSGTPAGVAWGVTPEGFPVLALTGSQRTVILFESPQELMTFGAMASHQAVDWMQRVAPANGEGPRPASMLVGADNLPLVRG